MAVPHKKGTWCIWCTLYINNSLIKMCTKRYCLWADWLQNTMTLWHRVTGVIYGNGGIAVVTVIGDNNGICYFCRRSNTRTWCHSVHASTQSQLLQHRLTLPTVTAQVGSSPLNLASVAAWTVSCSVLFTSWWHCCILVFQIKYNCMVCVN